MIYSPQIGRQVPRLATDARQLTINQNQRDSARRVAIVMVRSAQQEYLARTPEAGWKKHVIGARKSSNPATAATIAGTTNE
jgi:hypothetical protein